MQRYAKKTEGSESEEKVVIMEIMGKKMNHHTNSLFNIQIHNIIMKRKWNDDGIGKEIEYVIIMHYEKLLIRNWKIYDT